MRIGWDESFASETAQPYVVAAVSTAVETLAGLGAEIVDVTVPRLDAEELNAWPVLASTEAAAVHKSTFPSRSPDYGVYFRQFLANGNAVAGPVLADAFIARKRAIGRMRPLFEGIDMLACPTLATESFRYDPEDAYGGLDPEEGVLCGVPLDWFGANAPFITVWDYNGYPTLSVPCGFSQDRIPLSLQLVGPPLHEAALCRAGHAYEQATEWHLQHPDLI